MNVRTRVPSPNTQPAEPMKSAGELEMATPMPKAQRTIELYQPQVKAYPPKIAKALIGITKAIQPVHKAGFNTFHKYNYAKWEDILEQLGPMIADHGLIITQSEIAHGGFERDLIEISYEFTVINEDGDVWPDKPQITAICKVRDAKGVIDDKAASKCHTQAQRYMMVQLFKIRTADMVDPDAAEDPQPRKRPVPSPSGKLAPHTIRGVEGETAQTWTKKFLAIIVKAESQAELDQWDEMNSKFIDLVQERDADSYNSIVDAMNAKAATFQPKPDPISSGKPASDFPADKPMKPTAQVETKADQIPVALDRKLTDNNKDWLMSLHEAFQQCGSVEEIASEQDSLMSPAQATVSPHAWQRASDLLDQHIERVQKGGN